MTSSPHLSIILPTYNRAAFLPQAFASIRAQTFSNWELIVVDDGSTDTTETLLPQLCADLRQPYCAIRQENQGAYGARNTGLDRARGRYIAFFDSDDVWLPHYLQDSVAALEANPDVDWVYAACRIVEYETGKVLAANTFYEQGEPRPFLKLGVRISGELRVFDDSRCVRGQFEYGLYCGLQNSVIRRSLFETLRFHAVPRNEAEDQILVIKALAAGKRLGYLDQVHVIYHVHESNTSAAARGHSADHKAAVYRGIIQGFETLRQEMTLSPAESRALARLLSSEYFWLLGYNTLWCNGRRRDALAAFRRGLALWPSNLGYWKTYLLALLRTYVLERGSNSAGEPGK